MKTQAIDNYTDEDLQVWKILFERQSKNLKNKAAGLYLEALQNMESVLNAHHIPHFQKINKWFSKNTGWSIVVVPGLIPVDDFFKLLAQKKFSSSTWLRNMENLDYLEEPDMFHDIFGHIPLLSNPIFSEYVHEFGKLGLQHIHNKEKLIQLQRLYWFTIEFGVLKENQSIKSYGAGIISSFGETNQVFTNQADFLPFDVNSVLNKAFQTDILQQEYFAINSFEELYQSLKTVKKIINS